MRRHLRRRHLPIQLLHGVWLLYLIGPVIVNLGARVVGRGVVDGESIGNGFRCAGADLQTRWIASVMDFGYALVKWQYTL